MITVIATITILIACTIGAIVGFGGGVIIKPVLDSMGFATIDVVNFISSCAVLAMSISSIIRHRIAKTRVDKKIVLCVAVGAVVGGSCGNSLFSLLLNAAGNSVTKAIQAIMIIIVVIRERILHKLCLKTRKARYYKANAGNVLNIPP